MGGMRMLPCSAKSVAMTAAILVAVELLQCGLGFDATEYGDALSKSILFFEGQRSGFLPANQRMTWRWHSGLNDTWNGVDLTGGYYDAGDNVKFGFPMAFTTTMLSWSVLEFGSSMSDSDLRNALTAIRWGSDYLLKTVSRPDTIFVQVGDPKKDHNCWERPEDMDTERTVYYLRAPSPASEIAGETAAALASSSIAFRDHDSQYSDELLSAARRVFDYANTHRGAYHQDPFVNSGACPFYCDYNGYKDELLWAAAWLWRASGDSYYIDYVQTEGQTLSDGESSVEFGWDNKYGGVNVLLAREFLLERIGSMQGYKNLADNFMCALQSVEYTTGGLIYKPGGSNLQHATAISFLLTAYAAYLENSGEAANCRGGALTPTMLRQRARSQIDYILGKNPNGMSYMVGFGKSSPRRVHHRGSSIPSIKVHQAFVACKEGTVYFASPDPNPNELTGAVVGGPGDSDSYEDDRADAVKSEPTTYINAAIVGPLAYFSAHQYL